MYVRDRPDFLKSEHEVNVESSDSEIIKTSGNDDETKLSLFRKRFRAAFEHSQRWQDEAHEDYKFVSGKQWKDEEIESLEAQGRPAITINRIRPLLNIVSGYQRVNRYDINFLGRTSDDVELAHVRTGVTKYVLDRCEYENIESQVFLDCAISGIGVFGVKYKYDYEVDDGKANVERVDPFSIYVDPEAHELDYSDAKFVVRCQWCDKDELKQIYTEKAEDIEGAFALYDSIEQDGKTDKEIDPFWYSSELQKIRVCEYWYKVKDKKIMLQLSSGETIAYDEETEQQIDFLIQTGQVAVVGQQEIPATNVRCCTFFDNILLEDIESPYQHGEFPYVFCIYQYFGVGDIPSGFVRDLKNPQKELNKRRTQELHLLNTSGNGGGFIEEDAMSPEMEDEFKRYGNVPGHFQKVRANALTKIKERQPINPPTAIINAENQATNDLTAISGINEQLLGTDIPNSASGRAIELRQKTAVTHLAVIFDSLRRAKKRLAYLLWGKRGHAGLIPQYYTAEKTYRIEGQNGQQWITVNQQVVQQDPIAGLVVSTLNDLSQGDFDIVISDVEASTTQRQAQLWSLMDAVSKLNIPADLIFPEMIELTDLPKKNDIIQRYQERLQQQQVQQQQQAQAQLEIERIKNQNQNINIRDLPLPLQFMMAAQYGIIPMEVAQNFLQQTMPQLALAAQQQALMNQQMQQAQQQLPLTPEMMFNQPQQNQAAPMTQAAAQAVMAGQMPAM